MSTIDEDRAKLARSKAAKRIRKATNMKHTVALRKLEAGESEQDIINAALRSSKAIDLAKNMLDGPRDGHCPRCRQGQG